MIRRVVITGPTGAIGMALIERCLKENIKVIAVVHPDSRRTKQLKQFSNVFVIEKGIEQYDSMDIRKELTLCGIAEEEAICDVWFHLAWAGAAGNKRNDTVLQLRNIEGVLSAVKAAKKAGCHTFIGAGSQAEYGLSDKPLREDSPTNPITGYGIAKLCAGQMGKVRAGQIGIGFIWTRIFSVYGPYDGENTMIISGIRDMQKGIVPQYTKAEQQWDYLYSADAARALYLLAEKGKQGRTYCIGSGKTSMLKDYIYIIKDVVDSQAKLGIGVLPYKENQIMYLCADIGELKKDTGFSPEYDFRTGIEETMEWCRRELNEKD